MNGLLFAGIVAAVGAAIYFAWKKEQQRTEQMRAAAQAMGFSFAERDDAVLALPFPIFGQGGGRRAKNVMGGATGGRPVTIVDHQYTVRTGKNSQTFRQTVAVFERYGELPDFDLSPENVFHKIGQAFGYQDIDFDSSEAFSKSYLLRGPDEAAIRSVFGQDLLLFLAGEKGWTVQSRGGSLAIFRHSRRCDAAQAPAFLADCLRIASKLSVTAPS
jgi:hypothetical protein